MAAKASIRQIVLLVGLLVVLVGVVWNEVRRTGPTVPAGQRRVVQAGPSRAAAARDQAESAPGVRLSELKAERPVPAEGGRNLFREKPKAPPLPAKVAPPPPPDPDAPPPPPPPPPPITLKLIAIVQGSGRPIAAITDGRDVFYGREGDIIEGRYKIIKVNVESIDIAYVDGRGQRRLGLSG
jgi:hypothetical protein